MLCVSRFTALRRPLAAVFYLAAAAAVVAADQLGQEDCDYELAYGDTLLLCHSRDRPAIRHQTTTFCLWSYLP